MDKKTFKYSTYNIKVIHHEIFDDYGFDVMDQNNNIVMVSQRPYDSEDDACIRARIRINEELK